MRVHPVACAVLALLFPLRAALSADGPRLGQPASTDEIAQHSNLVYPDGRGLPAGAGSVAIGEALYGQRCVACHGVGGRGGPGGELAGGNPDLTASQPDRTIGTYWPYATTLFDFVRRSMPLDAPWSLSDHDVYAVVAYLLHLNGLLPADATLDAARLQAIHMPNRHGFTPIDAKPPDY
jgi:mono/diheme cytochrome c family protein